VSGHTNGESVPRSAPHSGHSADEFNRMSYPHVVHRPCRRRHLVLTDAGSAARTQAPNSHMANQDTIVAPNAGQIGLVGRARRSRSGARLSGRRSAATPWTRVNRAHNSSSEYVPPVRARHRARRHTKGHPRTSSTSNSSAPAGSRAMSLQGATGCSNEKRPVSGSTLENRRTMPSLANSTNLCRVNVPSACAWGRAGTGCQSERAPLTPNVISTAARMSPRTGMPLLRMTDVRPARVARTGQ